MCDKNNSWSKSKNWMLVSGQDYHLKSNLHHKITVTDDSRNTLFSSLKHAHTWNRIINSFKIVASHDGYITTWQIEIQNARSRIKTVSTVLIMSAFDKPVLQSTTSKILHDTEPSIPAHVVYRIPVHVVYRANRTS